MNADERGFVNQTSTCIYVHLRLIEFKEGNINQKAIKSLTSMDIPYLLDLSWRSVSRELSKSHFFGGYAEDDLSTLKDARDEVMNREVLAHTAAVQNEEVYAISTGAFYLPYFHTSVAYLAKWFHPEIFEDMDPEAIHQEYLEKYHGGSKDFTFVYPPMED